MDYEILIMKGTLYLIPSTLGESSPAGVLPEIIPETAEKLIHFIVEDIRTARRFLKKIRPGINIDSLSFQILNEHTPPGEIPLLLAPLLEGYNVGLLSEAGLPCVADPGSALVSYAHENGIKVVPLTGPSSIFLALMASGFNGQNFAFWGYLPIDRKERIAKIKELEAAAYQKDQTQIFIETPYRNLHMMEALIESCRPETRICIAYDLTLPGETIQTLTAKQWKVNKRPDFQKKPAVFLIYH
jgi:16S rRNA (cytidine1402-2'-O)-methyltransferase